MTQIVVFWLNFIIFQLLISRVFCKLFEVCKSSKYSSWSQLSDGTQHMGLRITPYDPRVILRGSIPKNGNFSHFFQTVISGTLIELSEVCKCSKYSSESQLSDDTQHMGLRITPCDPRVILRGLFWGCGILMMEMILGGNSYETSCWK